MGRTKQFNREDILNKALPLFWEKGFANTGLQELEQTTGVNKSGLYSEFQDKGEIFVESLKHYLESRNQNLSLSKKPLGWKNIQSLFSAMLTSEECNPQGCFMINSLRELNSLPKNVKKVIEDARENIKHGLILNLKAAKVSNPDVTADILLTFFSGLAIEENLNLNKKEIEKKIARFLKALQT